MAALGDHRSAIASAGATCELRRANDLSAAVALAGRLRTAVSDWRSSQPEDELLVQDLRSILEDRFDELGPSLLRLLKHDSFPTTSSGA